MKNKLTDAFINIRAAGDISFVGKNADRPGLELFQDVAAILTAGDLVLGNLEGPLTLETDGLPGKCNLRGHPGWAPYLKEAGFNFVSLANNHIMDFGEQGLFETIELLKRNNIAFAGAGKNITEASAPVIMEIKGKRVAIIARTSVIVSSPVNATATNAGIAFLNEKEIIDTIRKCRKESDLVILVIHWGLEEYAYPSPTQRKLARFFISSGIDIIIGHHPHILEGMEYINGGLCVYSLGNFLFNDFEWMYRNSEQDEKAMPVQLSPGNRKGMILKISCQGQDGYWPEPYFTEIDPQGIVRISKDMKNSREFGILSQRLKYPFYSRLWKFYSLKMEWNLRLKKRFGIQNLIKNFVKLRPRHIIELLKSLKKTSDIISQKTTNPYD